MIHVRELRVGDHFTSPITGDVFVTRSEPTTTYGGCSGHRIEGITSEGGKFALVFAPEYRVERIDDDAILAEVHAGFAIAGLA